MDKYIPVVKREYDEIMGNFPEFSNYTVMVNNMSLNDLIAILEIKSRKDIYHKIKDVYAKIHDSLASEVEKNRRRLKQ